MVVLWMCYATLAGALVAAALPAARLTAQPPAAPAPAAQPPAARPELLRGRVTLDTTGTPAPNATVTVTRGPDREVKQATAGSDGRWSIAFPNGTGDYLVHVAVIGRTPFRKRVSRAPGARDSIYVVDAVLNAPAVAQLEAVNVKAKREKPERDNRGFFAEPGTGGAERGTSGLNGAVSPDQAGDLTALAGTVPGVTLTNGGISALGLGPGQSNVTLGGLAFSGGDLPRDARTVTRVTTSTYDPSRGWFGAAQTAVELAPGFGFASRRAHVTADAPQLQAVDAAGARLGQRVGALQVNAGAEGSLADDQWVYNAGGQLGRRVQDAPSLAGAAPDALLAAGVAPDSAARLLAVARAAGIPLGAAGAWSPASRLSDQASFIARVDRPRYDPKTYDPLPRTYGVTAFGALRRGSALGVGPTALVTRGGETSSGNAGVQGEYSVYVGAQKDRLLEVRTGLSATESRTTPYTLLPGASVLVGSGGLAGSGLTSAVGGDSAAPALTSIALGGNAGLATHRRTALWETQGELRFLPPKRAKHRVTITGDARFDAVHEDPGADRLGSYGFLSLDDLAANRPSTYTRTLASPTRAAGVWNGYVAAGDYWRPSSRFQLLYGARLEGNAYTARPDANAALGALGVDTRRVPNTAALSPRLGFTWYAPGQSGNYGMWGSNLGTFTTGPRGVLRGGVGQFRNLLGPDLVAQAAAATGLPGATQRLLCVGSAVPVPQWTAWTAGNAVYPATCAGGASSMLTDTAPGATAFARGFTAPRSWRGNLAWSSAWKVVSYSVEGVASYNLNQSGTVDANFAGVPRFTTAEGRPVYVDPTAIVAATGALSPAAARLTPAFGRVALLGSDLRSFSRQLTVTLAPLNPQFGNYQHLGIFAISGAYVYGRTTQQARGFDNGAFGDPRLVEWARGDFDVRHQFTLQAGWSRKGFSLTTFGRFASGQPYTPLVGGDVNGDGLANDRAYALTPAQARAAGDTALASATERLLATSAAPARRCLTRILGGVAPRNGCEGPWTATMNARLGYDGELPRVGRRVGIAFNLTNPLGGLDQLLHGSDLRGWGAPAFPDPTLYQVRGFDPVAGRFRYAVNPRFGDTRPAATAFRAPFRLTLDVRLDLGKSLGVQQLDKWLKPGRAGHAGTRLSADELRKRYGRNVPDPYKGILQESDSLLLTREQSDAITAAQTRYAQRMDSLWTPLTTYLAAMGDRYDVTAALKRQEATTDDAWELTRRDVQTELPKILSPAQLRLLPWPAGMLYQAKEPMKGMRMFFGG